jgi:hypothetical protein
MNTRMSMRASAVFLCVLGIAATFAPQEILVRAGVRPVGLAVVLIQLAGALYLGFAVLNWMAQGNVIGGIYSRPVAVGNVAHFTIGGLGLMRFVFVREHPVEVIFVTAGYVSFAVLFSLIAFRSSPATRVDA